MSGDAGPAFGGAALAAQGRSGVMGSAQEDVPMMEAAPAENGAASFPAAPAQQLHVVCTLPGMSFVGAASEPRWTCEQANAPQVNILAKVLVVFWANLACLHMFRQVDMCEPHVPQPARTPAGLAPFRMGHVGREVPSMFQHLAQLCIKLQLQRSF